MVSGEVVVVGLELWLWCEVVVIAVRTLLWW